MESIRSGNNEHAAFALKLRKGQLHDADLRRHLGASKFARGACVAVMESMSRPDSEERTTVASSSTLSGLAPSQLQSICTGTNSTPGDTHSPDTVRFPAGPVLTRILCAEFSWGEEVAVDARAFRAIRHVARSPLAKNDLAILNKEASEELRKLLHAYLEMSSYISLSIGDNALGSTKLAMDPVVSMVCTPKRELFVSFEKKSGIYAQVHMNEEEANSAIATCKEELLTQVKMLSANSRLVSVTTPVASPMAQAATELYRSGHSTFIHVFCFCEMLNLVIQSYYAASETFRASVSFCQQIQRRLAQMQIQMQVQMPGDLTSLVAPPPLQWIDFHPWFLSILGRRSLLSGDLEAAAWGEEEWEQLKVISAVIRPVSEAQRELEKTSTSLMDAAVTMHALSTVLRTIAASSGPASGAVNLQPSTGRYAQQSSSSLAGSTLRFPSSSSSLQLQLQTLVAGSGIDGRRSVNAALTPSHNTLSFETGLLVEALEFRTGNAPPGSMPQVGETYNFEEDLQLPSHLRVSNSQRNIGNRALLQIVLLLESLKLPKSVIIPVERHGHGHGHGEITREFRTLCQALLFQDGLHESAQSAVAVTASGGRSLRPQWSDKLWSLDESGPMQQPQRRQLGLESPAANRDAQPLSLERMTNVFESVFLSRQEGGASRKSSQGSDCWQQALPDRTVGEAFDKIRSMLSAVKPTVACCRGVHAKISRDFSLTPLSPEEMSLKLAAWKNMPQFEDIFPGLLPALATERKEDYAPVAKRMRHVSHSTFDDSSAGE
jgi:hypothetical protein